MYPPKHEAILTTPFLIGHTANEYREGSAIDQSARSFYHMLTAVDARCIPVPWVTEQLSGYQQPQLSFCTIDMHVHYMYLFKGKGGGVVKDGGRG